MKIFLVFFKLCAFVVSFSLVSRGEPLLPNSWSEADGNPMVLADRGLKISAHYFFGDSDKLSSSELLEWEGGGLSNAWARFEDYYRTPFCTSTVMKGSLKGAEKRYVALVIETDSPGIYSWEGAARGQCDLGSAFMAKFVKFDRRGRSSVLWIWDEELPGNTSSIKDLSSISELQNISMFRGEKVALIVEPHVVGAVNKVYLDQIEFNLEESWEEGLPDPGVNWNGAGNNPITTDLGQWEAFSFSSQYSGIWGRIDGNDLDRTIQFGEGGKMVWNQSDVRWDAQSHYSENKVVCSVNAGPRLLSNRHRVKANPRLDFETSALMFSPLSGHGGYYSLSGLGLIELWEIENGMGSGKDPSDLGYQLIVGKWTSTNKWKEIFVQERIANAVERNINFGEIGQLQDIFLQDNEKLLIAFECRTQLNYSSDLNYESLALNLGGAKLARGSVNESLDVPDWNGVAGSPTDNNPFIDGGDEWSAVTLKPGSTVFSAISSRGNFEEMGWDDTDDRATLRWLGPELFKNVPVYEGKRLGAANTGLKYLPGGLLFKPADSALYSWSGNLEVFSHVGLSYSIIFGKYLNSGELKELHRLEGNLDSIGSAHAVHLNVDHITALQNIKVESGEELCVIVNPAKYFRTFAGFANLTIEKRFDGQRNLIKSWAGSSNPYLDVEGDRWAIVRASRDGNDFTLDTSFPDLASYSSLGNNEPGDVIEILDSEDASGGATGLTGFEFKPSHGGRFSLTGTPELNAATGVSANLHVGKFDADGQWYPLLGSALQAGVTLSEQPELSNFPVFFGEKLVILYEATAGQEVALNLSGRDPVCIEPLLTAKSLFRDVTDFGAIAGDGDDDSEAIRLAIGAGSGITYFPTGIYDVNRQINVWGNGSQLVGDYDARYQHLGADKSRPVLRLMPNTHGFDDPDAPKRFIVFHQKGPEEPYIAEAGGMPSSNSDFSSQLTGVDLEIEEGNSGAIALTMTGAQMCSIRNTVIDLTSSGYVGIDGVPGDSVNEDIVIKGGEYGARMWIPIEWPGTFLGCRFEGQERAGIEVYNSNLVLIDCEFDGCHVAITNKKALESSLESFLDDTNIRPIRNDEMTPRNWLNCEDYWSSGQSPSAVEARVSIDHCLFKNIGSGKVISSSSRCKNPRGDMIYTINDSFAYDVQSVLTWEDSSYQGAKGLAGGWIHIEELDWGNCWVNGANLTDNNIAYIGASFPSDINTPDQLLSPTSDSRNSDPPVPLVTVATIREMDSPPAWEREILVLPTKSETTKTIFDFGAKGDWLTDDTDALEMAASSGEVVWFPMGTYRTTKPLELTNGTSFIGEHTKYTEIRADSVSVSNNLFNLATPEGAKGIITLKPDEAADNPTVFAHFIFNPYLGVGKGKAPNDGFPYAGLIGVDVIGNGNNNLQSKGFIVDDIQFLSGGRTSLDLRNLQQQGYRALRIKNVANTEDASGGVVRQFWAAMDIKKSSQHPFELTNAPIVEVVDSKNVSLTSLSLEHEATRTGLRISGGENIYIDVLQTINLNKIAEVDDASQGIYFNSVYYFGTAFHTEHAPPKNKGLSERPEFGMTFDPGSQGELRSFVKRHNVEGPGGRGDYYQKTLQLGSIEIFWENGDMTLDDLPVSRFSWDPSAQ